MAEQRSVMKEFRSLDQKRAAGGLTPAEEARYAHLRDLVGPEMGAGGLGAGFDVDAAASELRESLLPAGLRHRPPPVPAPAPAAPPAEAPAAFASAYGEEPFAPLEAAPHGEAPFDPASFSPETALEQLDAGAAGGELAQPAWDPNAAEPAAEGWDPSAHAYDPNAPAWDGAQAQDPGAQAAWDAGGAYDPSAATEAGALAYDASALHEGSQGYDPNAQAAWDPDAPVDPNAPEGSAHGWDASGQSYDPNAPAWDAPQAQDPDAQGAWDPGEAFGAAAPSDPGALADDPSAAPEAAFPAEPGSGEEGLFADPDSAPGEDWIAEALQDAVPAEASESDGSGSPAGAGLESLLPFDPGEAAAIPPGEVPAGFEIPGGEHDETGELENPLADAASADVPVGEPGLPAAQAVEPDATDAWQPEEVVEGGFELASGGSFDAGPELAAPESTGETETPSWEIAAAEGEPGDGAFAAHEPGPLPADAADFELPLAPESAGAAPADLELLDAESAEPMPPAADAADFAQSLAGAEVATGDLAMDVDALTDAPPASAAHTLDFSRPDFSADEPPEEDAAVADGGPAPPSGEKWVAEPFDLTSEDEANEPPMDNLRPPPTAAAVAAPVLEDEEDIPTIDGEEILEEISSEDLAIDGDAAAEPAPAGAAAPRPAIAPPPPAAPVAPRPAAVTPPAPAAAAAPRPAIAPPPPAAPVAPRPAAVTPPAPPTAADPSYLIPGSRRVALHTIEGQVKRGVLEDADLGAVTLGLASQPGAAQEAVPAEKVKAIFFMLAPGEKAPAPQGKKVRVTFLDGRQMAGFCPDYREGGVGFFVLPADARTSTDRIWVYRSAVRQVSVT